MLREVNKNSTIEELQKSQFLRVVDVVFLGPLIIYAGTKIYHRLPIERKAEA